MRTLAADLPRRPPDGGGAEQTLVVLDDAGRVARTLHPASLAELATAVVQLAAGEPFVLGVNVPVVVPSKPARRRAVERLVLRRYGVRLPAGGRAAPGPGVAGEALLAALAAVGQPCLPYPDRDRRQSGLAETDTSLILKALLWESSPLAAAAEQGRREQLFRAYEPPAYRAAEARARGGWAERAASMDLVLRALGDVPGYDVDPARDLLARAGSEREVERAAGALDAALIAGTARRYLEAPETCLFLGDRDQGYVILPADSLLRRLALSGAAVPGSQLFPQGSLRERLGPRSIVRSVELLSVPGRPQRTEASFKDPPRYEFDNRDEMLWWKHCRHLDGPSLPVEGLHELVVVLGSGSGEEDEARALRLQRSRHPTLSFRFEPPSAWRAHVTTRDGKTYPFRVLRAVYETAAAD